MTTMSATIPHTTTGIAARAEHATKVYGGDDTSVRALDDVSVAFDRGRFTAVLFYGSTLTLLGIFHTTLWWYAAYRARVTTPDLSARERRSLTLGWSLGPLLYALMMAVAAVDPRYSIAGFALIHVLYLLPTARLVASVQRVRQKRAGAEPRRSRT